MSVLSRHYLDYDPTILKSVYEKVDLRVLDDFSPSLSSPSPAAAIPVPKFTTGIVEVGASWED
jgi:hypothetical protein